MHTGAGDRRNEPLFASPRIFTSFTNLFSKFPLGFHWKYPHAPYHPYPHTLNGYPLHPHLSPHSTISPPLNENKPIIVHHEEVPNPFLVNASDTDHEEPDLHVPLPDLSISLENSYPQTSFFFDPYSSVDSNIPPDPNPEHIHIHHVGFHEPTTKNTLKPSPNTFPRPIHSLHFGSGSTKQSSTIYHPSQLKPVSTTPEVFNQNFNVSINIVDERARLTQVQRQGISAMTYQKSPTTFRLPDALVTFNPEYISKLEIIVAFSQKHRKELVAASSSTTTQKQSLRNSDPSNGSTRRNILRPLLVPTRNVVNRKSEYNDLNNGTLESHDRHSLFRVNLNAVSEDHTENTLSKPFTRPKYYGSDASLNNHSTNASNVIKNKEYGLHDVLQTTSTFFYPHSIPQVNQEMPQLLKGLVINSDFLPQRFLHQNNSNHSKPKLPTTTSHPYTDSTSGFPLYSSPTATHSYASLAPETLIRFEPVSYSVISNAHFPIASGLHVPQAHFPPASRNLYDSLLHYSTLKTLSNFERKPLLADITARLSPLNGTLKLHDVKGPDDSNTVRQSRAEPCQFVNCQKMALICASGTRPIAHRQKRQLPFINELPFTCGLYEVCCRVAVTTPATTVHTLPPVTAAPAGHTGPTCGISKTVSVAARISTSDDGFPPGDASFGEYPWQAAVLKKEGVDNVYVCAGTLIDLTHVLTAAHCISGYHASEIRVRLGEFDVNKNTEFYTHQETDVIAIFVHPEFYPGNLLNDIALIKIQQPVDFNSNPHIAPVCLPQEGDVFTGHRCWVTGWGKDGFVSSSRYQNTLKEVDVPMLSTGDCQQRLRTTRLGPSYLLHPGMLCAGGEPGKDACKGDGGGPLTCVDASGRHRLAGLVSWGIGCGTPGIPGVYVNVQHYLGWILRVAL
ncbi:Serine proteases trypsin domain [Trinorchestia longiramus]|nr:Serine proteases trypsin domain [Trinorchestia longiramus]